VDKDINASAKAGLRLWRKCAAFAQDDTFLGVGRIVGGILCVMCCAVGMKEKNVYTVIVATGAGILYRSDE